MTVAEVLKGLADAGVALRLEGDCLRVRGPRGHYGPELRELVRANEAALRIALAPKTWTTELGAVLAVRWNDLVFAGRGEDDAHAQAVDELSLFESSPAPAIALRGQCGLDDDTFADLCRHVIHRPGPATADEDATVCLEILRRRGGGR